MTTLHVKSAKKPSGPKRKRTKWSARTKRRKVVVPCTFCARYVVTTINGSGVREYETDRLPGFARVSAYAAFSGLTPSMRRSMDAFYANVDARLYLAERRQWYRDHGLAAPFDRGGEGGGR